MNKREKDGGIPSDFDGVWNLDSKEAYLGVIEKVMAFCGIDLPPTTIKSRALERWGTAPKHITSTLIAQETDMRNVAMTQEAGLKYYDELMETDFLNTIRPVPGANETLARISDRFRVGLNTSANRGFLFDAVMPKLGLDASLFDQELIWTADDVPEHLAKPEPYVINEFMRKTEFPPEKIVAVGDAPADVISAHFAGVVIVVPLTGHLEAAEARELEVAHIIDNVTELEAKLDEIVPRAIGRAGVNLSLANRDSDVSAHLLSG